MDSKESVISRRTRQALPRDSVIEDLRLQNRYLQEKLHVLEKQFSKDAYSRTSVSVHLFVFLFLKFQGGINFYLYLTQNIRFFL